MPNEKTLASIAQSEHANKVAKVTALFWIMKIAATTLGETGGDLFSMTLNIGYAISSLALLAIFAVTLVAPRHNSNDAQRIDFFAMYFTCREG